MKTIGHITKYCHACTEEHRVLIINEPQLVNFKGEEILFEACFEYCENADEMYENEDQMRVNQRMMADGYRAKVDLYTSKQIIALREKYKLSQKDFSTILEWGLATITRYENYQVQDRVHDDVLRKLDVDPIWFMQLLERSKVKLSPKAYQRYRIAAMMIHDEMRIQYLEASTMHYVNDQIEYLSIAESKLSTHELVDSIQTIMKDKMLDVEQKATIEAIINQHKKEHTLE